MIFWSVLKHRPFDKQICSRGQHELCSAVGSHGVPTVSISPLGKIQSLDSEKEKSWAEDASINKARLQGKAADSILLVRVDSKNRAWGSNNWFTDDLYDVNIQRKQLRGCIKNNGRKLVENTHSIRLTGFKGTSQLDPSVQAKFAYVNMMWYIQIPHPIFVVLILTQIWNRNLSRSDRPQTPSHLLLAASWHKSWMRRVRPEHCPLLYVMHRIVLFLMITHLRSPRYYTVSFNQRHIAQDQQEDWRLQGQEWIRSQNSESVFTHTENSVQLTNEKVRE